MKWNIDKEKLRERVAKWLIKFRRIKSVSMTMTEINEMIAENLPETVEVPVPGCKGELVIYRAVINVPGGSDHFAITLYCSLHIESMANPIYRANVNISGIAWPAYDREGRRIFLDNIKVQSIRLVQDEYSILQDTKQIMSMFLPGPFRSVIGATVNSTLNVLSAGVYKEARNYLSLYMFGNKQKVLDYHKPELERVVKQLNDDGDLCYELDLTDFDERLFAELGKDVQIRDGELQFVFHR